MHGSGIAHSSEPSEVFFESERVIIRRAFHGGFISYTYPAFPGQYEIIAILRLIEWGNAGVFVAAGDTLSVWLI